jgi:hypothetical protein
MESSGMAVIQLELKYCERCGGLFLRRQGLGEIFCSGCAGHVDAGPVRKSRNRPRLPVNLDGRFPFEMLSRVAQEGGEA